MKPYELNLGGFTPVSTVDLPGRSACVVFFRGCPNSCTYCHNVQLIRGKTSAPIEYVKKMIKDSHLAISAVVFSGGEPTLQPRALIELLKYSRDLGLYTAIHTSGVYPDVLQEILARKLVDKIALDIKTTWEYYPALLGNDFTAGVQASLFFCRGAKMHGDLNDFEVVHTVFPGGLHVAMNVSLYAPEIPLVLQQGNLGHRGPSVSPLDLREIANICSNHEGGIRIRSRECGEEQVVSPIKPFGF